MKARLKLCAALIAALAAMNWCITQAEAGITRLLMLLCGYDYGRAAARAPAVFGLIFGIVGICILCSYCAWAQAREDEQRQKLHQTRDQGGNLVYWREHDE